MLKEQVPGTYVMVIQETYKDIYYVGLREFFIRYGRVLLTKRGLNFKWTDLEAIMGQMTEKLTIEDI